LTTGTSLDVELRRGGRAHETHTVDLARGAARDVTITEELRPTDGLSLVRAPGAAERPPVRLVIGSRVAAVLDPRLDRFDVPLDFLAGLEADEAWRLDQEIEGLWVPAARLTVALESGSDFQGLRAALKDAVLAWSPSAAVDELRAPERSSARRASSLASRVERLRALMARLQALVPAVRGVARSSQVRRRERGRWRPGTVSWRLRPRGYERVETPGGAVVVRPTAVDASRAATTWDLEEHRQLRRALRSFAGRAKEVSRDAAAARAAESDLEAERERALSPDERRVRDARRARLSEVDRAARGLARSAAAMEVEEPWIEGASVARTELRPTPAFRRVGPYRSLYRWLEDYRELERGDETDVLDRFKSTEELFEIWVFGEVLAWAERRFPGADGLVDRLAEVRRGDAIEVADGEGGLLRLVLEPVVPPLARVLDRSVIPYRASLSSGPLRPDVWLERIREAEGRERSRAAVLDAKCTLRFASRSRGRSLGDELESMRDYRTRIVEPRSGHQPVRASFQVHPVASAPRVCNVPGFFQRGAPRDGTLTGAVGARPGDARDLSSVLDALFAWL